MPSAFRYSEQKYNDALLSLGNIRVGTLHDFRRAEHKEGIADVNEGKKQVLHHIPYATSKDTESIHLKALEQFKAISVSGGADVIFENIHMMQEFDHPDCFVHCTSFDYSHDVMSQFKGADSCVEVFDLAGFYSRLTESLNSIIPVQYLTLSKVQYMMRQEDWNGRDWGSHPALIKEPQFYRQVELRAIWAPRFAEPISPIVINDTGLIRFCRRRHNPQ